VYPSCEHKQEKAKWLATKNAVTSCPPEFIASRPPCAAAPSATSTRVPCGPRAPSPPLEARIEMPPTLGRDKILGALNQVIQALAANRITARRAGILLQGIQMASGHSFSGPIDFDSPLDSVHTQNSPPHLQDLKK
jgi:hypothetical protein